MIIRTIENNFLIKFQNFCRKHFLVTLYMEIEYFSGKSSQKCFIRLQRRDTWSKLVKTVTKSSLCDHEENSKFGNLILFLIAEVIFRAAQSGTLIVISNCLQAAEQESWLFSCLKQAMCDVKPPPHCKSPSQIGGADWPSSLVEWLKNPGVDDKPSGFIMLNKANRLRHPVQLNVGKCQKKKTGRLSSLRFFSASIFVTHSSPPLITITGPSNLRYCIFVQHFWSCASDGENWVMKIAAEKIENVGSIFSAAIFITQPCTHSPSQSSQYPQNSP